MKTVLVVGATGQLGSRTTRLLLDTGTTVRVLVRRLDQRATALAKAGAEVVVGDLLDRESLATAVQGTDAIIATASLVVPGPGDGFGEQEVAGYTNLAQVCHGQTVVYVSAFSSPHDHAVPEFGVKRRVERVLKAGDLDLTIIRATAFMDTYLPILGDSRPLRGVENATLSRPFWGTRLAMRLIHVLEHLNVLMVPGWGNAKHPVVALEDVARCAVHSIHTPPRCLDLSGPQVLTWRQMAKAMKPGARIVPLPVPLLRGLAWWVGLFSPAASNLLAILATLGAHNQPLAEERGQQTVERFLSGAQSPKDVIDHLVDLLIWAPSAENCQPWQYHWDGAQLTIEHDEELAQHALNWENQESLLGLGAQQTYLEVACTGLGLQLDRLVVNPKRCSLSALISLGPTDRPAPLFASLQARTTHRGRFSGGPGGAPTTNARGEAQAFTLQQLPPRLVRLMAQSDALQWRVPGALQDLLRWIAFNQEPAGLNPSNLGVDPIQVIGLRLLKRFPDLQRWLRPLGTRLAGWLVRRQVTSAEGLVCIAAKDNSPKALVDCGALGTRVWLELTAAGRQVQPMSMATIPHSAEMLAAGHGYATPQSLCHTRGILAESFGLGEGNTPCWMFRYGMADPLPDLARTQRRPAQLIRKALEATG